MSARVRITLAMSEPDAVVAMGGGNPGGLTVCVRLLKEGGDIDPDGFMGGLDLVLLMDTFGIYEHRIWMLYKDVCKEKLADMAGVLRACQLGIVGQGALSHAIDNYGDGIDVTDLLKKVRERLPKFRESQDAGAAS